MKTVNLRLAVSLFVLLCFVALTADVSCQEIQTVNFKGTVKYINLEGGFWGIIAEDGKHYDPLNLPLDYKRDGIRVQVEAVVKNIAGFHMWGTYIEITSIKNLADALQAIPAVPPIQAADLSFYGVELGKSSVTQVLRVFGQPARVEAIDADAEPARLKFSYDQLEVWMVSDAAGANRVVHMEISGPQYLTSRGCHVGNLIGQVRAAYGDEDQISRQPIGDYYIYRLSPQRSERLVFRVVDQRVAEIWLTVKPVGP